MKLDEIEIKTLKGDEILPYLPDIAKLRIEVFRDYPYLYDGSLAYEQQYLKTYVESPDSIIILALDHGQTVGVSTGVPMQHETETFQKPFVSAGFDPAKIFYCGESILHKNYRGRGVYKYFFSGREDHSRTLKGIEFCAFCAVQRPSDHPLRPLDHIGLDSIWKKFGYVKSQSFQTSLRWKDLDVDFETEKTMVFWMKELTSITP
jgi:hypothetical protein